MAKILIVGVGDIGGALARRLIQNGHKVVGLRRTLPSVSIPNLSLFLADITNFKGLSELDRDFDQLFFAVAPDRRDEIHYRAIYETGLENLLSHFSKGSAQPHWIFVSSTAVYGKSHGEWVDECCETTPDSRTGQCLSYAEGRILADNKHHVIVRFSGIYGQGRDRLIRMTLNRQPVQSDPPYFTNRIHRDDCVGILDFLFRLRMAGLKLSQCYLGSDDEPAPLYEVIDYLSKQMKIGGEVAKKPGRIDSFQNKRCRNQRIKGLGYEFKFPNYRMGYQSYW